MFLAAVEVLRHPELAGKPLVVGGRGIVNERAVVSTASYEAREYGIRSGMPLRTAYKKCPDAVFLPVDAPHYLAASAEVMAAVRGLEWGGVPVVLEVLGWDEAFIGPGEGHGDLGDPWEMAMVVRVSGAGADPAALLGRHRQQQAAGQDRDGLRQAAGDLRDHRRDLVRRDGRPPDPRAVGRRGQDRGPAGHPRDRDGDPAGHLRRERAGRRSSGRRWGRGSTGWAAGSTPRPSTRRRGWRGRTGARRPTSGTWSGPRSRTPCARWPRGSSRTSTPRAGRRCGCT